MQHKTYPFESKSLQVGSSNPKEGTLGFNRTKVEFDKFLSVNPQMDQFKSRIQGPTVFAAQTKLGNANCRSLFIRWLGPRRRWRPSLVHRWQRRRWSLAHRLWRRRSSLVERLTANGALRSVKWLIPSLRESYSVTHKAMVNKRKFVSRCYFGNSVRWWWWCFSNCSYWDCH
jgi:hypothetical protein